MNICNRKWKCTRHFQITNQMLCKYDFINNLTKFVRQIVWMPAFRHRDLDQAFFPIFHCMYTCLNFGSWKRPKNHVTITLESRSMISYCGCLLNAHCWNSLLHHNSFPTYFFGKSAIFNKILFHIPTYVFFSLLFHYERLCKSFLFSLALWQTNSSW